MLGITRLPIQNVEKRIEALNATAMLRPSSMMETSYAGSYWLGPPESAEACARRAERFFQLLGRCDPSWARWWEPASSSETARTHPFHTDALSFLRLFEVQGMRGEEAFSFHLEAGDTPQEASVVEGTCGSPFRPLASRCVLRLDAEGLTGERAVTAPRMAAVLRAMVQAWDPEWAVATSEAPPAGMTERAEPGTFVGWVMYFSRLRGTVPLLPAPVHIEPVGDQGTLVTLTRERFTASNPEHAALAAHVHKLLDRAGLLRPLPRSA